MKIVQVIYTSDTKNPILGLGNNGKLYKYDYQNGTWQLFKSCPQFIKRRGNYAR